MLAHVGQLEDRAGLEAGRRLADAGVRRALCLNQQVGNTGLDARCAGPGARDARGRRHLARARDRRRRPGTPSRIARVVASDGAQGVLATNSLGGLAAAKGLAGTGVKIGTFDLGPDVLKAVQAGQIGFAVDQQAYLQGYLPIEMLALRARYGILPAQGTWWRRGRTSSRVRTPRRLWSSPSARFGSGTRGVRLVHPLEVLVTPRGVPRRRGLSSR